jgi:hypothetical protein
VNAESATAFINRPRDEVFAYLANFENLPAWAPEFAREVKVDNGEQKVVTPNGEIYMKIEADADLGVIDFYGGPTKEQMANFPVRVLTAPDGSTAAILTIFQLPDVDDARFARQIEVLQQEAESLPGLIGS